MNRNITIVLLIMLIGKCLQAQVVFSPFGANAWQMGGCGIFNQTAAAVFNNPAEVSRNKLRCVEIYHNQRYAMAEMTNAGLAITLPHKIVDVGIGINFYGFDLYNQQRYTFTASKQLSKQFYLGVQANYILIQMPDYAKAQSLVLAISGTAVLNPNWKFGFLLFNPTQQQYTGVTNEAVPAFARLGIGYTINSKVSMLAETDLQLNQPTIARFGLNYKPVNRLSVGIGFCNNPGIYTMGVGIEFKKIEIKMSVAAHPYLGLTPYAGMVFKL